MADVKTKYIASSALTCTLASLATSSTLLIGRECVFVDNSANLYLDYHVGGIITTGTSPTVGLIEVHAVSMRDDTNWPDSFTGTDAAKTITAAEVKASICKQVASMSNTTTSNIAYPFGMVSIASVFNMPVCPRKFLLWVTHSTGVNLNATGANQVLNVTGVHLTSI